MRSVMFVLAAVILAGLAGSALAEDDPAAPRGPAVEKERPGRGGPGRGPGPRRGPSDRDQVRGEAKDIAIPDALKKRLMGLSPEQRRQMMDRLQKMTPEQRREMFKRYSQAQRRQPAPQARRPERPGRGPAPQARSGQESMLKRMLQKMPEAKRRQLMERLRRAKPEDRAKFMKKLAEKFRGKATRGHDGRGPAERPQARRDRRGGPQAQRRGQQHGRQSTLGRMMAQRMGRGHPRMQQHGMMGRGHPRMQQHGMMGRGHPRMQQHGKRGRNHPRMQRRMQGMQRFPMLRRMMMMRRGGQQHRPMMRHQGQRQGRMGQQPAMRGHDRRGHGGGREVRPPRGKGGRCPHCGRGGDEAFGPVQAWWSPIR